jgi:fructosamine-3-kinase
LTLDDGTSVFAKSWPSGSAPTSSAGSAARGSAPAGFFEAEAAGLAWLRAAGVALVPEVIVALPGLIALEWVEPGAPTEAGAAEFGRSLAELHRSGAGAFGADWAGFIGPLPLDNTPTAGPWGSWFAERRLVPYLKIAADSGSLSATDVRAVEQIMNTINLYGANEPPARSHGDLWPGNVLWASDGRGWLIDPAAHGGHRETDLAELALFGGVAYLNRIVAAYDEVFPLAEGWRERVPLHQLHLLLVHAAAFGGSYGQAVGAAARAVLRA